MRVLVLILLSFMYFWSSVFSITGNGEKSWNEGNLMKCTFRSWEMPFKSNFFFLGLLILLFRWQLSLGKMCTWLLLRSLVTASFSCLRWSVQGQRVDSTEQLQRPMRFTGQCCHVDQLSSSLKAGSWIAFCSFPFCGIGVFERKKL